jgi:hypothetical protein
MNANMLTLAGLYMVIVVLLAVIVIILWKRANDRDDLDGLF